MKRILMFALSALLLLGVAAPAMAATPTLVEVTGSITNVNAEAKMITVNLSNGTEIIFNVDGSSVLLSGFDGKALTLGDLKAGMVFRAFHKQIMTASLPPQTYLHTLIASETSNDDFAHVENIKTSKTENGKTELLNKAGDVLLRLDENTDVRILAESGHAKAKGSDIKPGAKIIAWYQVMAMSYPGQAGPTKVLILSAGSDSSTRPPKTGAPVSDTLTVSAIVLSLACLGTWIARNKKEN